MPHPAPLTLLRQADPHPDLAVPSDRAAAALAARPASRLLPSIERVFAEFDRRQAAPAPLASDRAAVLDCLRVRDFGGDWLGHPSFDAGAYSDDTRDALVRDGLAFWDDFDIYSTPRGSRWAAPSS